MTQQDIPVSSHIFTNRDGNTLMKEFEGILENNPQVKNLDAVVPACIRLFYLAPVP